MNLTAAPGGVAFDNVNDRFYINTSGLPLANSMTTSFTVLMIRRKTDATLRNSAHWGSSDVGNDTTRLAGYMPWSDGIVYLEFGGSSGNNQLSVSGLNVAGMQKWAFTGGTKGLQIYLDGALKGSKSTAITRVTSPDFSINGSVPSGHGGDLQDVYFFAALDAEWTPSMIAEWTVDPWLMFEPRASLMMSGSAAPIVGSAVFGTKTTVTATRAIAFGLDDNTNIHSESGKFKVFGDVEFTGDLEVSGDVSVTGTATLPLLTGPFIGNQASGDFTIATGQYGLHGKRLTLTTTQRGTLQGTGRLVISG